MDNLRLRLREAIAKKLEPLAECLALAEGGSAAFGRADDLSDLDLEAIVEDGATVAVAARIGEAIESVAKIERAFELPQPTWHGAWQTFYQIQDHPLTLIDLCIIEKSQQWTLTEVERHGEPIVLFDKAGAIRQTHVDLGAINDQIKAKIAKLEPMVNMFHGFVDKEIERGRLIDAMHFYIRMILNPTVDVLRMKHDPTRHDFSGRYLYFDLPAETAKELESLFLVKDADDLRTKKARAVALFNESIGCI